MVGNETRSVMSHKASGDAEWHALRQCMKIRPRACSFDVDRPKSGRQMAGRSLDEVYAAIFIDAIVVQVRDGQVANRPMYARSGSASTASETSSACGLAPGGEGAKFWMSVLTDLRNRGVQLDA
jgi:hypothetical protein